MATLSGKKTGGRKKGTPNKSTLALQEILLEKNLHPIEGLKACLKELDDIVTHDADIQVNVIKAKANIFMDFLQYLYPKRKALEVKNETEVSDGPQIIKIQWADEGEADVSSSAENETTDTASDSDQPK